MLLAEKRRREHTVLTYISHFVDLTLSRLAHQRTKYRVFYRKNLIHAAQYGLSVIKTVYSSPSKVLAALSEVALPMTESMNGSQSLEIDLQRSLAHTTH